MTGTLPPVLSALLCGILVIAEPQYYSSQSYNYWSDPDITLPRLFSVDQDLRLVVIAAKNYIFHLSLDLKYQSDNLNVNPSTEAIEKCKFDIFQPDEDCQNFHHILYFQSGPEYINTTYGEIPIEETVLICGSNAYQPECAYRNRTDLRLLTSFEASGFCPFGVDSGTTIFSESGQLVAGLAIDDAPAYFAITLSTTPFSGELFLATIKDDFLYFQDPRFVNLYEHDEFYYLFMREDPVETNQHDTFSRVARVCKNDTGRLDKNGERVFVTYVKVRMVCRSTLFSSIAYDYNVLQDTVLVNESTSDSLVQEEHLYGIFTGEINGPVGSALCVYTFDSLTNALSGDYFLEQKGANEWIDVPNDPVLTCTDGRSYSDAAKKVLIKGTAEQETGEPMFVMDATVFHKLLVDRVTALDQKEYEVILIAASVHDKLQLLKLTYVASRQGNDKSFVSQAIPLNKNGSGGVSQDVGKMELYRTQDQASVYISTAEGLYMIPVSNCTAYSDCRSCVEARDPYCAYDNLNKSCVTVLGMNNGFGTKVQDVVNGNSALCLDVPTKIPEVNATSSIIPSTNSSNLPLPKPSPVTFSTEVHIKSSAQQRGNATSLPARPEPTAGNVGESESIMDHIWTIVAAVGGLIVGLVLGLLLFAAIRNREKFYWWNCLSHRRYHVTTGVKDDHHFGVNSEKMLESNRNNCTKPLPPRPTTPPLTKLNPITNSPVLTKYTDTSRHRRSNSSGGFIAIQAFDQAPFHLNNMKHTMHVEESVSNSDRQRFGKNVLSRQISKDYPMQSKASSVGYQVQISPAEFSDAGYQTSSMASSDA